MLFHNLRISFVLLHSNNLSHSNHSKSRIFLLPSSDLLSSLCKLNCKLCINCSTGNWSSPPPTCNPIQCPSLFLEDPHLTLTELNTSAWGKALFKCSWGYRLSGPPSLECEASGQWSGPVPRCRGNLVVDTFVHKT